MVFFQSKMIVLLYVDGWSLYISVYKVQDFVEVQFFKKRAQTWRQEWRWRGRSGEKDVCLHVVRKRLYRILEVSLNESISFYHYSCREACLFPWCNVSFSFTILLESSKSKHGLRLPNLILQFQNFLDFFWQFQQSFCITKMIWHTIGL